MKKLLSKEIIVGLFAAAAIAVFVLGYNFLAGNNLFKSNFELHVAFNRVDGLAASNPVTYKGFAVGRVQALDLNPRTGKIDVVLRLDEPLKIPTDSKALINTTLLGSTTVQLVFGKASTFVPANGSLAGANLKSLGESVNEQVAPVKAKAEQLLSSLDTLVGTVQLVISNGKLQQSLQSLNHTLENFENTTVQLDTFVGKEQARVHSILQNIDVLTRNLAINGPMITRTINNLAKISDTLATADINGVIRHTTTTLNLANAMLKNIADGKGTL